MATRTEGAAVPAAAWWLLLAATAVSIGAASWFVLERRFDAAGAATAAAAVLLVAGAVSVRRGRASARVLDSFADRAFDGCVFGSIAWVTRHAEPTAAAAALLALGAGFLAAYVRARGESLRYRVEGSLVTRAIRYGAVSVGLLGGWLTASLSAVAAFTVLSVLVRVSQVVKEERV